MQSGVASMTEKLAAPTAVSSGYAPMQMPESANLKILVSTCMEKCMKSVGYKSCIFLTQNKEKLMRRSACRHSDTRWRRPLPSRQVKTKCSVSAWKWSSRSHLLLRGDLGFSLIAIIHTACPASDSGGAPSSLRTQSLSLVQNAE
uniref:Uncharacterized protein n=1 Tax=Rousettus aegyptiacus TaxID=9407 RepID=A0A7J8JFY8_ROUAE|nr:hypothetical protein HJG63_010169 [Rousettus aegyptiacus]